MNADGGHLSRREKIVRGIDEVVAFLLSAREAAEADDIGTVSEKMGAAVEAAAALAKDLHA